ncbi:MAG: serine/threonine-protein kinase, partial [Bacteroidota bacterium]
MQKMISSYHVAEMLGEGGMGKVYLGIHQDTHVKVAIKLLRPEYARNIQIRSRFQQEGKALAALHHPAVVRFIELIELEDSLALVMEYVKGLSLFDFLNKRQIPLSESAVTAIFEQILQAIGHAHQQKIVHRDIKPSNIMLQANMQVKILDFGVAKMLDQSQPSVKTAFGTVLGSHSFMSPEQAQGLTIDHRTDIYSLGVLLFYMLSGRVPYEHSNRSDYELIKQILNEPLPRISSLVSQVSEGMQAILDTATHKNVNLRYQSCEEFRRMILR